MPIKPNLLSFFMTRNTLRRVEVAVPIYDNHVRNRIMHIFDVLIRDNVKARKMASDGTYSHVNTEGEPVDSQSAFIKEAYENAANGAMSAKSAKSAGKRAHKVKPTLVQRLKNSLKPKR